MGWTVNAPTVSLWVIYENLGDYPGKWVVRRWNISAGQVLAEIVPVAVVSSYWAARQALPLGLVHIQRHPSDDPCLKEVWL